MRRRAQQGTGEGNTVAEDEETAGGLQHRFYLVLDASSSMAQSKDGCLSPYEKLREVVPIIALQVADEPTVGLQAWLSVVTFNTGADEVLPLTPAMRAYNVDPLPPAHGVTDLAFALNFVADLIEHGERINPLPQGKKWNRPAVIVITDGQPQSTAGHQPPEVWLPSRRRLEEDCRARIVALGFGDADECVLVKLASVVRDVRLAYIDDGSTEPEKLIAGIAAAITMTIVDSTGQAQLVFEVPRGMRPATC